MIGGKKFNPWYHAVTWEEAAEVEWASGACDIPCREEDLSARQPLSVHEFVCWMQQCQDALCDAVGALYHAVARWPRASPCALSLLVSEHVASHEDPGAREVFLRVYPEAKDTSLEELHGPAVRRRLVQQMSTASANTPGTGSHSRHGAISQAGAFHVGR